MNNIKTNVKNFVTENKEFVINLTAFLITALLLTAFCIPLISEIHALGLNDNVRSIQKEPNEEIDVMASGMIGFEEETKPMEHENSKPDEEKTEGNTPVKELETTPVEEVVTEPVEEKVDYYDVPLNDSLQNHIFEACEEYGVDPAMVIAMMQYESEFNASVIGDYGQSYGLMQVQPKWHSGRMSKLGCTNLLDPYQNITVAVDFIAELESTGRSMEWVLMAYNGGYGHANSMIAQGRLSVYATTVLNNYSQLSRR